MERLLDATSRLDAPWLHLAAAGLAFGETAILLDLIVPGEVGMVVAGASAKRAGLPVVPVIAAAAVEATVGDTVSYFLGRSVGRHLLLRWKPVRDRVKPKIERAANAPWTAVGR